MTCLTLKDGSRDRGVLYNLVLMGFVLILVFTVSSSFIDMAQKRKTKMTGDLFSPCNLEITTAIPLHCTERSK